MFENSKHTAIIALVFDGTHATGYMNGIDSKGPQLTGIGANVAAPVYIGASSVDAGGRVLKGLLDDVRLYNYPRNKRWI